MNVKELVSEDVVDAPDMAVVEAGEAPQAFSAAPKKDGAVALSNLKPMDVQRLQRLLKMGKKSRKPEYPGETVILF